MLVSILFDHDVQILVHDQYDFSLVIQNESIETLSKLSCILIILNHSECLMNTTGGTLLDLEVSVIRESQIELLEINLHLFSHTLVDKVHARKIVDCLVAQLFLFAIA